MAADAAAALAAADERFVSSMDPLTKGQELPEVRRAASQRNMTAALSDAGESSQLAQHRASGVPADVRTAVLIRRCVRLKQQLAGVLIQHQLRQLLRRRGRPQQRQEPRKLVRKHRSVQMLLAAAAQAAEQTSAAADQAAEQAPAAADQTQDSEGQSEPAGTSAQPGVSRRVVHPLSVNMFFLARAGSPGVMLQVLQFSWDQMSMAHCATAYRRLAELCMVNPHLLAHPATQQLLQLLKWELPRMQQLAQPWHLAVISAAGIQLQQPELPRVMLPLLLQDSQLQPAQLGASIVACYCMPPMPPLGRALLRLLLQDGQLFACDCRWDAAGLSSLLYHSQLQMTKQQQQLLLDTLLELVDTSSPQQAAAAIWLAAAALPQWVHLLEPQLLSQATPAAAAAVLGSSSTIRDGLSSEQLDMLLTAAAKQLPAASASDLRICYEGAVAHRANNNQRQQHAQLGRFLGAFMQQLPDATARDVYGILAAGDAAGYRFHSAVLEQLLCRFAEVLPGATHWQVTGVLCSLARQAREYNAQGSLGYAAHSRLVTEMVAAFLQRVPAADAPFSVVRVLWAVATMRMGYAVTVEQLRQFEKVWTLPLRRAGSMAFPADFHRMLWGFAQVNYLPRRLLAAAVKREKRERHHRLLRRVEGATVQQLSAMVMVLARWGDAAAAKMLLPVYRKVSLQRLEERGAAAFGAQAAANLAWANAVLTVGMVTEVTAEATSTILKFAAACREIWESVGVQEKQQLHQVHLWLLHLHPDPELQGLKGVLSCSQLDRCGAVWKDGSHTASSKLQVAVFGLLQQLPASTWQSPPVLEHRTGYHTGHFSIDIAAVRADGRQLAIEVDGPWHFTRPGNKLDGCTKCRNLMLDKHGWTVVSVPYFELQAIAAEQPKSSLDSGTEFDLGSAADVDSGRRQVQLEYLLKKVQEA
jgi:hypothetical protein